MSFKSSLIGNRFQRAKHIREVLNIKKKMQKETHLTKTKKETNLRKRLSKHAGTDGQFLDLLIIANRSARKSANLIHSSTHPSARGSRGYLFVALPRHGVGPVLPHGPLLR